VAVAALLIWLCTAAVGSYLLVTAIQAGNAARGQRPPGLAGRPAEAAAVPAGQVGGQTGEGATAPPPLAPVRPRDRWDPPSLQRAKNEEMPGLRDLAEFAHPALALIGFGFWLGYVISRDRLFAAIGLGILLGAVAAGVSWFTVNRRDRKRAEAAAADRAEPGDAGPAAPPGGAPLLASPRLLLLHAAGAAATVLFVVLIAARV
jgi:hypothetical protein